MVSSYEYPSILQRIHKNNASDKAAELVEDFFGDISIFRPFISGLKLELGKSFFVLTSRSTNG